VAVQVIDTGYLIWRHDGYKEGAAPPSKLAFNSGIVLHRPEGGPVKNMLTSIRLNGLVTVLTISGVLLSGPLARAQSGEDGDCSLRTLRGSYGFSIDGQILAGPRMGLLRGVAMTEFDGRGNLRQVDFTTINGVPTGNDWRPATGSYRVNADCTGTAEIIQGDGSPTLKLRLVVVRNGKEVRTVVEGNATGSIGIRVQ
jgi:hypothetical protein